MSGLQSDSDSDSDYAPEKDDDRAEGGEEGGGEVARIPQSRKRKAGSLFEEMAAQERKEVQERMHKSVSHQTTGRRRVTASRKKKQKLQDVLTTIFGSKSSTFKQFSSMPRGSAKRRGGDDKDPSEGKHSAILETAKELAKKTQKKVVVTETKKFAGQEISVERTLLLPGSAQPPSSSSSSSGSKDSSLDKVLQEIKGPQTISTVSKSSMDWDSYKDKEGLEEDLAGATKEGYLTRKDFLERCDVRAFEKERDQRLLTSAKK